MKRYERMLVCIGRAERAANIFACVRAIASLAESRTVHLLHVAEDSAEAADGSSATQPAITPDTLRHLAAEHLSELGDDVCRYDVVSGSPLLETLRVVHDTDPDLIVIGRYFGRQEGEHDEALLARRITRKATCTVLVLPEEYQVKADTILVPARDSDCSAHALDAACGIADATGAGIIALNVFQVPAGYSRVGTTLEEHQALLETAAERECRDLLKRVEKRTEGVVCKCVPDLLNKPVPVILETIAAQSADLVVIGARGRTGAAGVLLGSVTEQLIQESPVPVLAVKRKGECLGVLRALLSLATEG